MDLIINWKSWQRLFWHGSTKGYGEQGTPKYNRRTSFARVANSAYGTKGTVSVNGVKMGRNAVKIAPQLAQSFGGAQRKEENRRMAHDRTTARLSGNTASAFRSANDNFYE